ncbi:MAG TPA: FlgD immunoglobulin-like domain containing protein [bacterium]|nr:FlgD immunoglobulin-like domain containing protein [bacterium]
MRWPRETLIQLYLEGGLRPEAQREFNRLMRKDPTFPNEVTEAAQRAFRSLPVGAPPAPVPAVPAPTAPPPVPVRAPLRPRFSWPAFEPKKLMPHLGLGLMVLAALGVLFLAADWIRQARPRPKPRPAAAVPSDPIRQVLVKDQSPSPEEEGAIGVSPSLSAAGKELVFQVGDRIYLSIQSARKQNVTLSICVPEGRVVRRLYSGEWQKGAQEITWDGLDGAGRPTPPGAYLVVLKAGGKTMSDRLILEPAP